MDAYTRDISSSGAFLVSDRAQPGQADWQIVLHFSCLLGVGSDMTAQARVVRREAGGVAVTFARIEALQETAC